MKRNDATGGGPAQQSRSAVSRKSNDPDRTPDVGKALRSAYQDTVDEDIPAEFLDLLGKLK